MTPPPGAQERAVDERIDAILVCWCHEAYKGRGLTQPDCPQHQFADDIKDIVHDAIAQAVQAEREACARIADLAPSGRGVGIADMIRARPAEPAGAMPDGSNWNWPAYGPGHVIE